MRPSTMWLGVYLLVPCVLARTSKAIPGLSFAAEPESDLNERGNVSFVCEPQTDYEGLVEVEWFRNGVRLEPNSPNVLKMDQEGKQHILEIRESEKARFYCIISLEGTPLKLISQTALSIPMTIEEYPGSTNARHIQVREGSTAVIPCGPLPRSEPKARSVLKFKKREIPFDRRFKQMPSGDIFIYNATREDAGDYICVAENPLTGKRKEAPFKVYLIVSPREPNGELRTNATLVHGPPARIEAVVGSNVTMECIGNGFPKPTVSWQRVGSFLRPGYSEGDGTLTLQSVTSKHSGIYECSVENFVSVVTQTELVVLEPPRLKIPERTVFEVLENMPVTIECEVTRGEPKPNVTWYFNGGLLTTTPEKRIYVSQSEVHITKASRDLHMGHFQCFADNSLGTTYVQYLVRILTNKEEQRMTEPPPTPKEVGVPRKDRVKVNNPVPSRPHVKQDDQDAVTIDWTISNASLSVKFFKVQYICEVGDWQTEDPDISPTTRSYRVGGLKNRKYRFRVIAVYENNSHGTGKSSRWFLLSRSKKPMPSPPAHVPDDTPKDIPVVTVTPDSPSSLSVSWKMAGPVPEGFLLKYRRTDSAGEWLMQRIGNAEPWTFTISHLAAAQHYEVKIAALGRRTEGNFSSIEVARTQESNQIPNGVDTADFDPTSPTESNDIGPNRTVIHKQHRLLIMVTAVLLVIGLSASICLIHQICRVATSERPRKPNERLRRQREAAAYVNDANSNFTPSISTVDLQHAEPDPNSEANSSHASDSEESTGPESLQSTSHERVPRSEKEYALKILTSLYTTNGHIVNINSNFNTKTTCVQSV
ncbi:interference hedgehog-like [Galendromus occidentalis]|uniref:Interference hedgehog-like n=1 Tax=Galendromus occidentalis TaxID=34638 RepID=A0AAJ6QQI9_9ACAR|nr:interference hedgehog-like [Galendromus occidentalis]